LNFFQGELFIGVEFGRSYSVKPNIQIGYYGRGYETETEQGFTNDLLNGNGGMKISGSLNWQF
jgi:hypothetical protein